MILPDVNILIHAFRTDAIQHPICRPWLEDVIAGEARFGISPMALSALARVTTNFRSFKTPSTLEDVFRFSDHLLGQSNCQIVEPGARHWSIFKRLCIETDTRGP